ncbi:MAG: tRNA (N6-threonylcarbamoyladenosine(37)-N6)-methyltransferase TrmO [Gammaproteobacteria bacterium]|nr:tRNA (N6-threonylcarbamoyladenosine(37)-N6)-methyltransferase TrmO [Gammaproteobacteria bacterium]
MNNKTMRSIDAYAANADAIQMNPIGFVSNEIIEPAYIEWKKTTSQIVLHDRYVDSLDSLVDYSHVMIVFWMHQVCITKERHVPQGKYDVVPEVGMFACRCPHRPNPIACTTVPLLGIDGNVLTVKGLDAVDATPVIDIKPYTPQYDFICDTNDDVKKLICNNVRLPEWIFRLTY